MSTLHTCETEKPTVNVIRPHYTVDEKENAWEVKVWLPGVSKEDSNIKIEKDHLHVEAQKSTVPSEWSPLYREITNNQFELKLQLGEGIDKEKVDANIENGILTISLTKAEIFKSRTIEVR